MSELVETIDCVLLDEVLVDIDGETGFVLRSKACVVEVTSETADEA